MILTAMTQRLAFGRFVLDLGRGSLHSGDREIPLRPKTWAVLRFLAENPDRLIPKEELLEAVWAGLIVTDDTLVQSIGELNWTALALGGVVVCLDLGFFMLYRGGFDVSLGQLITQSAASLILLLLGVAYFAEKLSLVNIGGILLCIAGLWLINKK